MDLHALFAILSQVARDQGQITYGDLSRLYHEATGEWHEPFGSWDVPLGEINVALHNAGLPALSAVVVLQETREPGGRFWESSPNIPARPRNEVARIAAYGRILHDVHAANWPAALP